MKKLLPVLLALASSTAIAAGIADTKHNLGSTGPGNKTSDTTEICVFCHTPHGAAVADSVPLWNKNIGTVSYTTYADAASSSIDGEILSVGSVSLACLSCHDGTQAMDNIINAPGSNGYDATGGGTDGLAWTWSGNVSATGKMAAGVTNLSTDLTNDHPIGIEYCGGGITGSGSSITGSCVDADFKAPTTKLVNGDQVFWVETGASDGIRSKTDITLYTRSFGGTARPSVECGSCHDPHVGAKGINEVSFLRVSQANSGLCLACHVK